MVALLYPVFSPFLCPTQSTLLLPLLLIRQYALLSNASPTSFSEKSKSSAHPKSQRRIHAFSLWDPMRTSLLMRYVFCALLLHTCVLTRTLSIAREWFSFRILEKVFLLWPSRPSRRRLLVMLLECSRPVSTHNVCRVMDAYLIMMPSSCYSTARFGVQGKRHATCSTRRNTRDRHRYQFS